MDQRAIASLLTALFAGIIVIMLLEISSHVSHTVQAKPVPAVASSPDSVGNQPILTQQSASVWTTTVLVNGSLGCAPDLSYQLVTIQPDSVTAASAAVRRLLAPSAGRTETGCGTSGEYYEADLTFRLPSPFRVFPLGMTLVIFQPGGKAQATIALTPRRLVTDWQDLWVPIEIGAGMAVLFALLVLLMAGPSRSRRAFWSNPLHAAAAWTLRDSLATNTGTAGAVIVGFLTTTGAFASLFPGVQLNRYTVLLFTCAAIIAASPLLFTFFNAIYVKSHLILPDDAAMVLPGDGDYSSSCTITVPAGASITFPGGARALHDGPSSWLPPGTSVSVPLNGVISVAPGARIALAAGSTTTIAFGDASAIGVDAALTPVLGPGFTAQSSAVLVPHTRIILPASGAIVAVTGTATIALPAGTELAVQGSVQTLPRGMTYLKTPGRTAAITADMRSVIPAAMVTMFGIGVELGIITELVLLSGLAIQTKIIVEVAAALVALVTLCYASLTTRLLANPLAGRGLSACQTSFTP